MIVFSGTSQPKPECYFSSELIDRVEKTGSGQIISLVIGYVCGIAFDVTKSSTEKPISSHSHFCGTFVTLVC